MSRSYMFSDRTAGSERRKREDQQVEIRRQRTDELLNKKRAAAADRSAEAAFAQLHERLNAPSIEVVYKAVYDCRNSLSVEENPPIQAVIDSGVVPRIVQLLDTAAYAGFRDAVPAIINKTKIEAAWVVTNIASGTTEQTNYLADQQAIPSLIAMLNDEDHGIVDQSVWALGNLAGDCEKIRDKIIDGGALFRIVPLIERYTIMKDQIRVLRNLTWLMANLCRGRSPAPSAQVLEIVENVVEKLIMLDDSDVVSDCFWSISYIVDMSPELTETVLASPIMRRCHDLLSAFAARLSTKRIEADGVAAPPFDASLAKIAAFAVCPIIRTLGNIVTGSDAATGVIVSGGFLSFLPTVFYNYETKKLPRLRKDICWLLSNVTAGTPEQVAYVIDAGFVALLIDSINNYELYIRKEASYAVLNILHFCSRFPERLQPLLDNNIIQAMQSYLAAISNTPDLQAQHLDAFRYALEAGEKIRARFGDNPVVQAMIDCSVVDEIEELQDVASTVVSQKAYNIIVDFFDGEDEH
ncbi:importin subunit alpha-6/7 [Pancytospora philotis]|nr:importin subunit alpha-6/7 [Pancytospora philotis]